MILLPTYNRIEKLKNFMKSAVETMTGTPGLVLIDAVDYTEKRAEYLELEATAFPDDWKIKVTQARGMGAKVREVWPIVREHAFVGILNDDHICITKNWDAKLTRQLTGKNFISCNDNWNAPYRAAGATIWSMPLLECVGWPIFPPQIEHLGVDDCWELLGRATGCWTCDMSVVIEHSHVLKGAENDETHKLTYGTGAWENSPAAMDCAARLTLFTELELKKAVEKVMTFTSANKYFEKPLPMGG